MPVKEVGGHKWFVPDFPFRNLPLEDWEKAERDWILKNTAKGGVLLDIGANAGAYSITLARHFETVYAVEPAEDNIRVLVENARLNGVENLVVLPYAAWHSWHHLQLQQVIEGDVSSGAVAWDGANPFGMEPVKTFEVAGVPLDDTGIEPTVVKIDTEGAEIHVILGLVRTIAMYRPIMLIEVHDERFLEFTKLLMEVFGYELVNPEHFARLRVLIFRPKEG